MLNYLFISSLFLLTSPFSVGQTKSYERYYSAEHLRQHPGQEITWIKMSITRCGKQGEICIGEYGMGLSVGLKNRKEAYELMGFAVNIWTLKESLISAVAFFVIVEALKYMVIQKSG